MKRQIETIDIVLFGLLFVVSTSILGLVEERVCLLQTIETLRQSNAVLEEENRALRAQCATSQNSSQRPSVFLTSDRWFVSIQTEREVEQPVPQATTAVGIDLGVVRFATLSDGTVYAPLNSFRRHEEALRKAQQALARKTKFSNNWKKAKAKVLRIHARIANVRRDYLHKVSNAISKNHALVCIEDLRVRNMSSRRLARRRPGKKRSGQVGSEQIHPRSRLVRVPPPTGLQAGMERRFAHHRTTAEYQSYLSVLRLCFGG